MASVAVRSKTLNLEGWIPFRVYWKDSGPMVDWFYFGDRRLGEPFFEETLQKLVQRPFHLLFRRQTPLETLREWSELHPGLRPTGFIFHMSRCGSTLISQMLGSLPDAVVISEAAPLDAVIRPRFPAVSEDRHISWIRWMVSALGQPRTGVETRYFIKFDCWHTLYLPLIRRAFPSVPWIFLYRNPVEVLVSQMRIPAAWCIPGMIVPELMGVDLAAIFSMPRLEYCTRVLASICERALVAHREHDGKLVNYGQLPDVVQSSIAAHFGLTLTPEEQDLMGARSARDAKSPVMAFQADSESKQREAPEDVRALAEQWLLPLFERLEQARLIAG